MTFFGFQRQDIRLTLNLTKMNLRNRYLGSVLGLTWAVLNPLVLLGIYTFIFGFIYKARVPGSETTLGYAIWLISGLVPYLAISESLTSTAGSVIGSAGLVKNVVFKSEILPIASALASCVPFIVGMCFLLILLFVDGNYPTWHVLGLIPVIILQITFLAGLGFFLGATSVFIRDIIQVLTTVTLLIIFFTPIFYTLAMLPPILQKVTFLNPFYHIVRSYRYILMDHRLPSWWGMGYLAALSAILCFLGLKYFRRLKGYFEIVL
ncbi:MAG: ABC transporter permease [Phycisphaerae bacterium]|nr:ABC transporter permease [Phycisphaerae bacterium]